VGLSETERLAKLDELDRQIADHPGRIEYVRLQAFARMLGAVFVRNLWELLALLNRAAIDEELAMELVQNVRDPVIREAFQAETLQRLHNYVAASATLVDHSRRLLNGQSGPLVDEFEVRKRALNDDNSVIFVLDLRNFTVHRTLPFLAHTVSLTNVNTPNMEMTSEVELSTGDLKVWTGWDVRSKAFLEDQGERLALRPVIAHHGQVTEELNRWLSTSLAKANEDALDAVNRLIVEATAIRFDTDMETAERFLRERPFPFGEDVPDSDSGPDDAEG